MGAWNGGIGDFGRGCASLIRKGLVVNDTSRQFIYIPTEQGIEIYNILVILD